MKFAFIKQELTDYPVEVACEVLEVSRSGFYAWRKRDLSDQERRREVLAARIQVTYKANRCVYGSPRIHQALLAQGEKVCQNTVAKCMRKLNLRPSALLRGSLRTSTIWFQCGG